MVGRSIIMRFMGDLTPALGAMATPERRALPQLAGWLPEARLFLPEYGIVSSQVFETMYYIVFDVYL